MLAITALVFLVSFVVSAWFVRRHLRRPDTILMRVMEPGIVSVRQASPISWSRVFAAIGALQQPCGQDKMRMDFLRAGIRSQHAESIFRGLKIITATACGLLAAALSLARGAEPSHTVMFLLAGLGLGTMLPAEILRIKIRRRAQRIEKSLPNALDLLTICVEAGLGLDQAIIQVSRELSLAYPDISAELSIISLEMRAGKRRADALRDFASRTGIVEVKKLAAVLIQADRFGTSIAQSLRNHSEHMRVQARQIAEEKAAKLGVKLVFPIFFFILPSLFVITVGPVIVRILFDLLPMMNSL